MVLKRLHLICLGSLEMPGHHPITSLTDVSGSTLMYLLDMYKHSLSLCVLLNESPTFCCYSCTSTLFEARLRTVINAGKEIPTHAITPKCPPAPVFRGLTWKGCSNGFLFFFYCNHFDFIVSHKPCDTGGESSLGSLRADWPVGIWQWFADPVQLQWWLSSYEATGLRAGQPIAGPRHSAADYYGSPCVSQNHCVKMPLDRLLQQALWLYIRFFKDIFSTNVFFCLFCFIPPLGPWTLLIFCSLKKPICSVSSFLPVWSGLLH